MRPKSQFRISVALKFLILFIVLGTVNTSIIVSAFSYFTSRQPEIRKTIYQMVHFIGDTILDTPGVLDDPKKLSSFANRLGVDIQIRTDNRELSTLPTLFDHQFTSSLNIPISSGDPGRFGEDPKTHRYLLYLPRPGSEILFITPRGFWVNQRRWIVYSVYVVIAFMFLFAFLVVRRFIRPLQPLMEATTRFKDGDLKHRIPILTRDEFGDLAHSFNEMASNLDLMIRNKEQLLLDVSHELRSPLTRMRIALELMPEVARKSDLLDDVREMDVMVNDLLESHRMQNPYASLHKEVIDLATLIHQVCARFVDRKPGVQLDEALARVQLKADPNRISSLVRNVIENAVKYSAHQSIPVHVALRLDGPYAAIIVKDHGPGIPEDEIEKVFEPFYRVDKSRTRDTGGYGLGLPLCRNIATAHGGSLVLENSSQGGLVATVLLPYSQVGAEPIAAT